MEIKTIEIAGMVAVMNALRLPYGKEARSDVSFMSAYCKEDAEFKSRSDCFLNSQDIALLSALVKRGDEHAKVIRGLVVYAEIEAPRFFWEEECTYRIGAETLSSGSTMHTIGNGEISIHNFDVPEIIKEVLSPRKNIAKSINPLYFEIPEKLECKIQTYFDRKYEIWNNGDIYALAFTSKEVMPNGTIRNREFKKQKIVTGKTMNHQGYYQVHLGGREGKTLLLHRVIAKAFVENPNNYNIVNHKDGNKGNCSPSNLEWCTSAQNNKHAFDTGLKKVDIKTKYLCFKNGLKYNDEIINKWIEMHNNGLTYEKIADMYNASISMVQQYCTGNRFKYSSEYSFMFNRAKIYEDIIAKINELSELYQETKSDEYIIAIKEMLPESFIQKRIRGYSYQCLRNIVRQRYNHRLPQWHEFIKWVATLPLAKEFIFAGLDIDIENYV